MAPAGMASIERAKDNGAWTVYDPIEDLVIPPDLAAALQAEQSATEHFEAMTDSVKKGILWWIASAARPETRSRRVTKTVEAAACNRSPL